MDRVESGCSVRRSTTPSIDSLVIAVPTVDALVWEDSWTTTRVPFRLRETKGRRIHHTSWKGGGHRCRCDETGLKWESCAPTNNT